MTDFQTTASALEASQSALERLLAGQQPELGKDEFAALLKLADLSQRLVQRVSEAAGMSVAECGSSRWGLRVATTLARADATNRGKRFCVTCSRSIAPSMRPIPRSGESCGDCFAIINLYLAHVEDGIDLRPHTAAILGHCAKISDGGGQLGREAVHVLGCLNVPEFAS